MRNGDSIMLKGVDKTLLLVKEEVIKIMGWIAITTDRARIINEIFMIVKDEISRRRSIYYVRSVILRTLFQLKLLELPAA